MSEPSPFGSASRNQKATVRAGEIAGQQWGVIGSRQLRDCGLSRAAVSRWRADGKLHVIHPAVYALGHPSVPTEGRLVAALLHAGNDAVLSHASAAWWWGLIAEEPATIEVSSESRARSCPGVVVHHPRRVERTRHRRFPITTVPQTLLDVAANASLGALRRALAEADYKRLLDPRAIEGVFGRGRPGAAKLRRALERHQPRLARTRSQLERRSSRSASPAVFRFQRSTLPLRAGPWMPCGALSG
jgi:predicted transcriptional regulator of viral defense system